MLKKLESISDVNRGPESCQSGTALTFPVSCLAYTRVVSQIDGAVRAYEHAHDDHYLTCSKFNSLLTEMITPQTYIQIYIYTYYKTASCTSCIRGSLRLAPNYTCTCTLCAYNVIYIVYCALFLNFNKNLMICITLMIP